MGGTRRVDTDEAGERLTAADKDSKRLLIEERLAKQNGLKVGDKITPGWQRREDHGPEDRGRTARAPERA
ncbi:hypothetical protein ACFV46_31245 [Streptomyces sp. NPDC059852]|uniref:hypothetical protein n=1 Tax=Streptomyces sp. NPDC059852 TaxID=3346972 RepID=UPI00365D8215